MPDSGSASVIDTALTLPAMSAEDAALRRRLFQVRGPIHGTLAGTARHALVPRRDARSGGRDASELRDSGGRQVGDTLGSDRSGAAGAARRSHGAADRRNSRRLDRNAVGMRARRRPVDGRTDGGSGDYHRTHGDGRSGAALGACAAVRLRRCDARLHPGARSRPGAQSMSFAGADPACQGRVCRTCRCGSPSAWDSPSSRCRRWTISHRAT